MVWRSALDRARGSTPRSRRCAFPVGFAGEVLEAELETKQDLLVYIVEMVGEDGLHRMVVDGFTGEVLSREPQDSRAIWSGWFAAERLKAARVVSDWLPDTITAAQRETEGRATRLSLEEHDGSLWAEIEFVSAEGEQEVMVDSATGDMLPDGPKR